MDFRRKSRQRIERKPEFDDLENKYPHNVSLYRLPPTEDIQIHEFEELALERLKVLRILEQANNKSLRFLFDDYKEYVNAELMREGLKGYMRLLTGGSGSDVKREFGLHARRRDYISHFILRLVYCRTDDMKRWFLIRELELFKYKFAALSSADIKQFLDINKLSYVPLSEEQKNDVKDGLYESTIGQSVVKIEMLDFYKVPFGQVLDLVRTRRCYLKDGYAYVNTHDFVSIIAVKFLNEVEHGLQSAERLIPEVETDERLSHLLKSLHTTYTGKDYTVNKECTPIESLDQLSKKSYPLCMRMCHDHLRANHHLKYFGRTQYGLFLKGIGVTLEDALRFWRDEFTKKIDAEAFAKKYEYNIRHNYGKKGSMIDYMPYNCMKIIQENTAVDVVHGCPYKLYDPAALKAKLVVNGLGALHVQDIMGYVEKGHYQLACAKYFQVTHDSEIEIGIIHPNQYFKESQNLMGNRVPESSTYVGGAIPKKSLKRAALNDSAVLMNTDDDVELWNIAETQETELRSKEDERTVWDEDLDITKLEY